MKFHFPAGENTRCDSWGIVTAAGWVTCWVMDILLRVDANLNVQISILFWFVFSLMVFIPF